MTTYELSGTIRDTTSGRMDLFQYYGNGMLKLSEEGEKLLSLLPGWLHNGPNVRNVQEALGLEFERLVATYIDLQDQLYATTATWGLRLWEEMLALPIQNDLSEEAIERRRVLVLTALSRESFTSEAYFQQGIATLAGLSPSDVVITPLNRANNPYSWRVEIPISYFETGPASPPTAALGVAGNVPAGTYTYKVGFDFATGSTLPSTESNAVVLATGSTVVVSDVALSTSGAVGRTIYRKETGETGWTRVGTIPNNSDTIFVDNVVGDGVTLAPTVSTAKTELALQIEKFIADAKPAHLRIQVGSVGFRADVNAAGDPL